MPSWKHSRRTTSTISTHSEQLQDAVPQCAQSCLSTYISQGFGDGKVCSDSDLSCLCSKYSSYGLSLGELALICVQISDCGSSSLQNNTQQTAFDICSGQSNAVQATHAVLSPPRTTQSSSQRTITPYTTTATPSTTAASATGSSSSSTRSSSSTSSSFAAATASPNNSSTPTGLTSPQVIGISIAAVGFVVLAIAFAYIMACVRRRKRSKQEDAKHSNGFSDDKTAHQSWFTFPNNREHHDLVSQPHERSTNEKPAGNWQSHQTQLRSYHTREAAGPRTSISRESLRSSSSIRTVSRLLPEKPSRTQPQIERPSAEPLTVQTPATIFEEDRFSVVPRPIPSLPKNPRQPQYAHQFTKSPEPVHQPSLSLDIPRQATRSGAIQAVAVVPPPQDSLPKPFYECSKAASSTNSFLNYYEGPDSGSPEDYYPYTPIDEHTQIRRPAPAAIMVTKPTFPPVAVRTSMASDNSRRTSFESTDPDEPTPPEEADEEDKRLTPVAESPISGIRYPKIPRGSNQAVPRSPPQPQYKHGEQQWHLAGRNPVTPENRRISRHSPSLSGSTLAAKRLGDHAAHNLEKGLRINPAGTPPEEQGKIPRRHGNNHSPANWPLPSQEPLKSPLWEPKLTPRRMGGDLYLSVSVATPKQAHFFEH